MNKAIPLSNVEILHYFRNDKKFFGVISKDEIPQIKRKGCYIINLRDSTDPEMGHWIVLSDLNKDWCLYFDTFGQPPPTIIDKWMRKGKKQCIYSTLRIQNINSILCGYYCVHVVNELLKDSSIENFINIIFSMK